MNIFIDTSALLAVLDADDAHHKAAGPFWESIVAAGDVLVVHNYILEETSALVLRKLGLEALRRRSGIRKAFAFDRHFQECGYVIMPS